MSNPYESPYSDPYQQPARPYGYGQPTGHERTPLVQQVRIIAILNAVQGGLEVIMGLIQGSMAFFFPALMMMEQGNQGPGAPPDEFFWVIGLIYGVIGLVLLTGGGLRIFAAIRNYRYRGRMLGIVSFGVGLLSIITCYCAPTAIGLLVWGLIAYLNPSVMQAFEMGEQGESPEQIMQHFSPYGGYQ